jgi:hypothetical protein
MVAARADLTGHFGAPRTLEPTPPRSGFNEAQVGDGDVAIEHCASKVRCSITVHYASGDRFTRPQQLTSDGKITYNGDIQADPQGDQIIAWTSDSHQLYAAIKPSGAARFGPPYELSATPVAPPGHYVDRSEIAAGYGPAREAIVTWRNARGQVMAAVYS